MKIDITEAKIDAIMNKLDKEEQQLFKLILKESITEKPIEVLSEFINNFDKNDPVDSLLIGILMGIIEEIPEAINREVSKLGENNAFGYRDAMVTAAKQIIDLGNRLMKIPSDFYKDNKSIKEALN